MSNYYLPLHFALIGLFAFPASATADENDAKLLHKNLQNFSSDDLTRQKNSREQWQQRCFELSRPANSSQRSAACREMMRALSGKLTRSTSLFLLQQVERIGGDESVEGLVRLLGDADKIVADAARRALANNPSEKAAHSLERALAIANSDTQIVQLINSLAFRKDYQDLETLTLFLDHSSPQVVVAAAAAVSQAATDEAAQILIESLRLQQSKLIAPSALALAAAIREAGNLAQARRLYEAVLRSNPSGVAHAVAIFGAIACSGDSVADDLLARLNDGDEFVRQAAINFVSHVDESELDAVLRGQSDLPNDARTALFIALGTRRVAAAQEFLIEAASNTVDDGLRIAAIEALGDVGGSDVVPLLLSLLDTSNEGVAKAAAKALGDTQDPQVDKRVFRELESTNDNVRRETLISILNQRRWPKLADVAVDELGSDSEAARRRSIGILTRLGTVEHVTAALLLVDQIPSQDFGRFSKAIVAICSRIPNSNTQAQPVIEAYASADRSDRPRLLSIIGTIGGKNAADFVNQRLEGNSGEEAEAAVTALANWPDASVVGTLLKIAQRGETESQRIRALRGIARVAVLPNSPLSESQQLKVLTQAMKLTTRLDERKLILDRAKAVDLIESVRFIRPFLDNTDLREVACKSITQIGRIKSLRDQYPELVDDLRRIIEVVQDEKVRERAKNALLEI